MKRIVCSFAGLAILLSSPATGRAQSYSIDWYKISGGGGASTGGVYSVSGTIGQHDAGGPMTGGGYSLYGGYWALYAVQTPGLPWLYISRTGPSNVLVWWLSGSGSFTLQTNNNLTASPWVGYGGAVNSSNGTNSVTISPPTGNLYFRLKP